MPRTPDRRAPPAAAGPAERDLRPLSRTPGENDRRPAEQPRDRDRAGRVDQRHGCELARERRRRRGRPAIERIPQTSDHPARGLARRAALLLDVGASNRCGWDRPADHSDDDDQHDEIGKRLHEHLRLVAVALDPGGEPAEEAEQEREREGAAPGRQPPAMSAASPMKPRPAVMFSVNECDVADRKVRAARATRSSRRG